MQILIGQSEIIDRGGKVTSAGAFAAVFEVAWLMPA